MHVLVTHAAGAMALISFRPATRSSMAVVHAQVMVVYRTHWFMQVTLVDDMDTLVHAGDTG